MLIAVCGCAGARRQSDDAGAPVALYRGRLEEPGGRTRSFRLLLYAALPDRIHAEVLSPVGTPHLVLDAGAGRVALTFPQENVAYVGAAGPEVLERVVGLPGLSLEPFVRLILTGEGHPPGLTVRRVPSSGEGLPRRLELETREGRKVVLERREKRSAGPLAADVATGTPPPGVELRPIETLEPQTDPTR